MIFFLFVVFCLTKRRFSQEKKFVVSYFTDWTSEHMSPEQFPYSLVTHINYAFAIMNEEYEILFDTESLLIDLVDKAHKHNVKVLMSVGGWTGSKYFSLMAKEYKNRNIFIKNLLEFLEKYNLDGIDLDWEYPGRKGMKCNYFDIENDSSNLQLLVKEIKQQFSPDKLLSLTVRVEPFDEVSGPTKNVSYISNLVDFINVMAYDINGAFSPTTGPNSPLEYEQGKGLQYSFKSSINSWLYSGVPKSKLIMGLAFYGRSVISKYDMSLNSNNIYQEKIDVTIPRGDSEDELSSDPCPGSTFEYSGIWKWRNLRKQRILISPEAPGKGWNRYWDKNSQTPWLYNNSTKQFISYDDPISIRKKVEYTIERDLKGVMIWSSEQDNGELMNELYQTINPTSTIPDDPPVSFSATKTIDYKTPSPVPDQETEKCSTFEMKCFNNNTEYGQCFFKHWRKIKCEPGTYCQMSLNAAYCYLP